MKKNQIVLPIESLGVYSRPSWIEDGSNLQSTALIDKWPDWPRPRIVCINGGKSCGKTHLSHIWVQKTGAFYLDLATFGVEKINKLTPYVFFMDQLQVVNKYNSCIAIDGVDHMKDEEWLFHFYNFTQEHKVDVLLTSTNPPSRWGVGLPDLSSRLATVISTTIEIPTDETLARVILKQFNDLGLIVEPKAVDYLIKHCDRSFGAVYKIVKSLNEVAACENRAITIPFIRDALQLGSKD